MAKERSPLRVLIYTFISFGIYGIYWLYQVFQQVLEGKDSSPVLWFLGMLVPVVNIVILWKFTQEVDNYSGGEHEGILLFVLYIVFAPAAIYLIQSDLNAGLNN